MKSAEFAPDSKLGKRIDSDLRRYIEAEIVPRYDGFDAAHRRDHVQAVIERSLTLAEHYAVNADMVYAIAAYHDTGLAEGREHHHEVSARIIRADEHLHTFFTPEQIETMADAAEDHRASAGHEPRTIYGKIVAEADRLIEPQTVIRRTVQYGLSHYPQYEYEKQFARFRQHLHEKYADGGYIRLWLPQSDNAVRLEELRQIIRDEKKLREAFETAFLKPKH